jgi:hypothetical protein
MRLLTAAGDPRIPSAWFDGYARAYLSAARPLRRRRSTRRRRNAA